MDDNESAHQSRGFVNDISGEGLCSSNSRGLRGAAVPRPVSHLHARCFGIIIILVVVVVNVVVVNVVVVVVVTMINSMLMSLRPPFSLSPQVSTDLAVYCLVCPSEKLTILE